MKKKVLLVFAVVLSFALLIGCGRSSGSYDSASVSSARNDSVDYAPEAVASSDAPGFFYGNYKYDSPAEESESFSPKNSANNSSAVSDLAEKIIYSAYMNVETVKFEETVEDFYSILDFYGAFLQSSSISGTPYSDSYSGRHTYRHAEFVVRVPKENFAAMTQGLSVLGNVTNSNVYSENITEYYNDTESRLKALRIEEERLLSMLEKAVTVEEMITVEARLSDIRYEIESLTSSLRNWDNEINYSTVTIYLSEVGELSEQFDTNRTYWQEITDGLSSSLHSIGRFFKILFRDIIVALPTIIIIILLAIAVVLIIRSVTKKRKLNKSKKENLKQAKRLEEHSPINPPKHSDE